MEPSYEISKPKYTYDFSAPPEHIHHMVMQIFQKYILNQMFVLLIQKIAKDVEYLNCTK